MKTEDKAFSVETPEDSPGFLLWQVTNLWQRELKKALEKLDLTHAQFVLLASTLWLSQHQEDVTQVILSSHTKIDPMTTSTVLRTLQKKGLLSRQEHSTDTRAKTVVLTANGQKIAKQAVKLVEKFDDDFFSPLGDKVKDFNKKIISLLQQTEKS
jgi:DNA-binding MarR family transcriptional regulator